MYTNREGGSSSGSGNSTASLPLYNVVFMQQDGSRPSKNMKRTYENQVLNGAFLNLLNFDPPPPPQPHPQPPY